MGWPKPSCYTRAPHLADTPDTHQTPYIILQSRTCAQSMVFTQWGHTWPGATEDGCVSIPERSGGMPTERSNQLQQHLCTDDTSTPTTVSISPPATHSGVAYDIRGVSGAHNACQYDDCDKRIARNGAPAT